MELSIKDRLYLPNFLPAKGTFMDFNLKKSILRKIEISEDERKEINFRENKEENRLEWDVENETPLIVDFSTEETDYLRKSFEKISDEDLPDEMWETVKRIYDYTE